MIKKRDKRNVLITVQVRIRVKWEKQKVINNERGGDGEKNGWKKNRKQ